MKTSMKGRLVSYDRVATGFEAMYVEEDQDKPDDASCIVQDNSGKRMRKWSLCNCQDDESKWDTEIKLLNRLQSELGQLEDEIRKIRAHIASLTPCDSGLPVTVHELLAAIGSGQLKEPSFHNGCWNCGRWWKTKCSQPDHIESMRVVHDVLTGYLEGESKESFVQKYPYAKGFIGRTYEWLGSVSNLTQIQKLLIERMLLPFEFFTKASHSYPATSWPEDGERVCEEVMKNCYEDGSRGSQIDSEIARLANLPKISMKYPKQVRQVVIEDPKKQDLYILCCALAHGLHTLSDCHHSTFRWIENWIYSIGTGRWGVPSRRVGAERERVGHLLFGYLLGLDKWLMGIPEQFLLLDLGHVDLGFDPKNEIVRVYAYLGETKTPVKEWLAACLWHSLMYSTGGLHWRDKHSGLIQRATKAGVSIREWMDSVLANDSKNSNRR